MSEYVATFKTSVQIAEDSWKVVTPTLLVTDTTTIGEIMQWAKNNPTGEITLSVLDKLSKI